MRYIMNIFGYTKNSDQLLTMEEISIQCNKESLEDMISFFSSALESMDVHKSDFGHEHFSDWMIENKSFKYNGIEITIHGEIN